MIWIWTPWMGVQAAASCLCRVFVTSCIYFFLVPTSFPHCISRICGYSRQDIMINSLVVMLAPLKTPFGLFFEAWIVSFRRSMMSTLTPCQTTRISASRPRLRCRVQAPGRRRSQFSDAIVRSISIRIEWGWSLVGLLRILCIAFYIYMTDG